MTSLELQKLVENHPHNASKISRDLGVSRSAMSNWLSDKRGIGTVEAKLLRLYFLGEMPFDLISPEKNLANELRFTTAEWEVITILAGREGFLSAQAWLTAKIRGYLDNNPTAKTLAKSNTAPNRGPSTAFSEAYKKLTGEPARDEDNETA
jgi:DNA-binding transcriptional ArsR family regulator